MDMSKVFLSIDKGAPAGGYNMSKGESEKQTCKEAIRNAEKVLIDGNELLPLWQ